MNTLCQEVCRCCHIKHGHTWSEYDVLNWAEGKTWCWALRRHVGTADVPAHCNCKLEHVVMKEASQNGKSAE